MTFNSLLVQTAEVWRRKPGRDRFNNPIEEWASIASYPCRIGATMSGGEQDTERMREVYHLMNTVFLPPEADVREDDEISVLDPQGAEIFPRAAVRHKQPIVGYDGTVHHYEVHIEVSRGPK